MIEQEYLRIKPIFETGRDGVPTSSYMNSLTHPACWVVATGLINGSPRAASPCLEGFRPRVTARSCGKDAKAKSNGIINGVYR